MLVDKVLWLELIPLKFKIEIFLTKSVLELFDLIFETTLDCLKIIIVWTKIIPRNPFLLIGQYCISQRTSHTSRKRDNVSICILPKKIKVNSRIAVKPIYIGFRS